MCPFFPLFILSWPCRRQVHSFVACSIPSIPALRTKVPNWIAQTTGIKFNTQNICAPWPLKSGKILLGNYITPLLTVSQFTVKRTYIVSFIVKRKLCIPTVKLQGQKDPELMHIQHSKNHKEFFQLFCTNNSNLNWEINFFFSFAVRHFSFLFHCYYISRLSPFTFLGYASAYNTITIIYDWINERRPTVVLNV